MTLIPAVWFAFKERKVSGKRQRGTPWHDVSGSGNRVSRRRPSSSTCLSVLFVVFFLLFAVFLCLSMRMPVILPRSIKLNKNKVTETPASDKINRSAQPIVVQSPDEKKKPKLTRTFRPFSSAVRRIICRICFAVSC